MAASSNRPAREIVEFPPNVAVTLALKYNQGKLISNQYGERMMFTTTDNRVMFLDLEPASQIATLGINVRENFTITKQTDGRRDSPLTWTVARVAGEQPNGTLVVPSLPNTEPTPRRDPSRALVEEANALVDAYAEVLTRTLATYQGRVKPEEARALLITAYIQRSKLSSVA